jgi:hypothetical protein
MTNKDRALKLFIEACSELDPHHFPSTATLAKAKEAMHLAMKPEEPIVVTIKMGEMVLAPGWAPIAAETVIRNLGGGGVVHWAIRDDPDPSVPLMWRGYTQGDVRRAALAAIRPHPDIRDALFVDGEFCLVGHGDTHPPRPVTHPDLWEAKLRSLGLRRPDEPDYKPVVPK